MATGLHANHCGKFKGEDCTCTHLEAQIWGGTIPATDVIIQRADYLRSFQREWIRALGDYYNRDGTA